MLNLPSGSSARGPSSNSSSNVTPHASANVVKYGSNRSRGKRSMPAGTGVWVVNTPPARTASIASANDSPCSVHSRTRSRPRNPAWPSLVWNTCGCRSSARRARTPPMPRTISWRSRCCSSPPYSRLVTAIASGGFPGTFVSSRYRRMRPTSTRHTRTCTSTPARSTTTCTPVGCAPSAGGIDARRCVSSCQPSALRC